MAAADGFSIKRIPSVGSNAKYKMTAEFMASGAKGTLTATLLEKITNVDKDGNFTVEQSQVEASGVFDGEQVEVPTRPPVTMTYKANGLVSTIQGALTDASSYRMENLGAVIDPGKKVDIDEVWTSEIKADKTLGTRSVRVEYKLLAEEKVGDIDTLKIKGTLKETDGENAASNDITVWINKADGSLVQLQAKWSNAPFPGTSSPVSATIKITKIAS